MLTISSSSSLSSCSSTQASPEISIQPALPFSVLVSPKETCRGHSWYMAFLSPTLLPVFLVPSGNIEFSAKIGIKRTVKAPVNIPVFWSWSCHLSHGTSSLSLSVLPSSCSHWFCCARSSERRNQTPGQERICIELAPFPEGGGCITG